MGGGSGRRALSLVVTAILLHHTSTADTGKLILDRDYWYAEAQKDLTKRLQEFKDSKPVAKSVVMFIGDGMSLATVTAARELKQQRRGEDGPARGGERGLIWDHFPAAALAQTYNLNAQTGESSACATALLCGVKANYETLGVDGTASFENCSSSLGGAVPSALRWAQDAGKWTGIVTTTRVTHATPAALYAHSPSRYWEDDSKVPAASRAACKDIALQLVDNEPGRNINVVLGGGRRHWLPTVARDPEQPSAEGRRLDGRNLIDDWLRDKKRRKLRAEYVWNKEQFDAIDPDKFDYLLGLFEYSHMGFAADQEAGPGADPSLLEMTLTALSILEKNPKGFFLMVEGGRIDHAHHYNNPYRALDETLQLEAAVRAAVSRADLLLVTADHGHVMTIGGHSAPRDHPILGPLATVLFSGTFEQSYIPHAVAYIACLGEQASRCEDALNFTQSQVPSCLEVKSPPQAAQPPPYQALPPGKAVLASSVVADDFAINPGSRQLPMPWILLGAATVASRFGLV